MTSGRWMDDAGSKRTELREVIAKAFMDETGSTWLYDKGEWLVDLLTVTADGLMLDAIHEAWRAEQASGGEA